MRSHRGDAEAAEDRARQHKLSVVAFYPVLAHCLQAVVRLDNFPLQIINGLGDMGRAERGDLDQHRVVLL
jgi:hypothetical protein